MSRDEPQKINHDGYYIINLDKEHGGYEGTHWVGLIIKHHLFKHYNVHYNDVKYQDKTSAGNSQLQLELELAKVQLEQLKISASHRGSASSGLYNAEISSKNRPTYPYKKI
jgi:hypothetical protein